MLSYIGVGTGGWEGVLSRFLTSIAPPTHTHFQFSSHATVIYRPLLTIIISPHFQYTKSILFIYRTMTKFNMHVHEAVYSRAYM